jgi:hypothetical protein
VFLAILKEIFEDIFQKICGTKPVKNQNFAGLYLLLFRSGQFQIF